MKCIVLNLPNDRERMAAFATGWKGPWPFERFEAVDGRKAPLPGVWRHGAGLYGLTVSYALLFARLIRDGVNEPVAIFEDDALLADGWHEVVTTAVSEAPAGWWHINLGCHTGDPNFQPPAPITPTLGRLAHAWRTQGVIYSPAKFGDHLLALGESPWPVDQIWCDRMIRGSRDFYCTRKFLCGARAGKSTCTDHVWPDYVGPNGLNGWQHPALAE